MSNIIKSFNITKPTTLNFLLIHVLEDKLEQEEIKGNQATKLNSHNQTQDTQY
jgi:hypothetical protein